MMIELGKANKTFTVYGSVWLIECNRSVRNHQKKRGEEEKKVMIDRKDTKGKV